LVDGFYWVWVLKHEKQTRMTINLPKQLRTGNTIEVIDSSIVIVGANGAGKTRFGSKIESEYPARTHRIAAQKSLSFPTSVSPKSIAAASNEFLYGIHFEGSPDYRYPENKSTNRWKRNWNTKLLDDYEKLLVLLFTEEFHSALKFKDGQIGKPTTKLDDIKKTWESLLPHRKLKVEPGVIKAYDSEATPDQAYNATEMSDGERVILYLIGEALCAPENAIIIFDEPEMHLHSSLTKDLYDSIEAQRPDCIFIYLTHNIDFAKSRSTAIKIWVKSFDGNDVWDYEILDNDSPLPENLYLELLGSRKPIMFVEGSDTSLDLEVYSALFKEYNVVEVASCARVIHFTKAFNAQNYFHHILAVGLIDRDFRTDQEIASLVEHKIYTTDVSEVENIFLSEQVLRLACDHLGKDFGRLYPQIKSNAINSLAANIHNVVNQRLEFLLKRKLGRFTIPKRETDREVVVTLVGDHIGGINVQEEYDRIMGEFDTAIAAADYDFVLKNNNMKKGLISDSGVLGLLGLRSLKDYLHIVVVALSRLPEEATELNDIRQRILPDMELPATFTPPAYAAPDSAPAPAGEES